MYRKGKVATSNALAHLRFIHAYALRVGDRTASSAELAEKADEAALEPEDGASADEKRRQAELFVVCLSGMCSLPEYLADMPGFNIWMACNGLFWGRQHEAIPPPLCVRLHHSLFPRHVEFQRVVS